MIPALLIVAGFILGSIPVGYLIARSRGIDIRTVGSGNIGATNVYRALGKGPGLLVFFLDVVKGLLPACAGAYWGGSTEWAFLAGAAAVVGHSFSPFLGFKGGKGIATGLGALLGSVPLVAVSAFAVFFAVMTATMIVSLSSIAAGFSLVVFGIIYHQSVTLCVLFGLLGVYVLVRHRSNLTRVKERTEPQFGQKPGEPPPANGKGRLISALLCGALIATAFAIHVYK